MEAPPPGQVDMMEPVSFFAVAFLLEDGVGTICQRLYIFDADSDTTALGMALQTLAEEKEPFKVVSYLVADHKDRNLDELHETIMSLIKSEKKISAIKEVRAATGMGLKEAKDYVDQFIQQHDL